MKIIQINGFRGLLFVAFVGICLFAGFVVFPGLVSMYLWNRYLVNLASFPSINLVQGTLLWGIIAVSYFILSKGENPIAFKRVNELSNSDVDDIIRNAKIQAQMRKLNREIQKTDKFEKNKESLLKINNKDLSDIKTVISPSTDTKTEKEDHISNVK